MLQWSNENLAKPAFAIKKAPHADAGAFLFLSEAQTQSRAQSQ